MVNYTVKKLDQFTLHKGHQTAMITFKKGKYTREQIRNIVEDYNNTAYEKGFKGYLMTSLKYPDKYRGGKPTKIGEPVNLFSFAEYEGNERKEPDYFKQFYVYISTPKK